MRGSTPLQTSATDDEVLGRVILLLRTQKKPVVHSQSDEVVFEDSLFRISFDPNWHSMAIYDQGKFWIESERHGRHLKYDLRSRQCFHFCLFGAVMFFLFGLAFEGVTGGLKYALFAFGWVYGMNLVIAWARIPKAIRNAVQGT
jgi:hypothetical protein